MSCGGENPLTASPRESRRATLRCPGSSRSSSPLPGRGEGAPPPGHSTCAPWETGVPGPPRDSARSPTHCPRKGAEEKGWEAGGGTGRSRGRASRLPWSTDPMMRRGWQCPSLNAACLCIWRGWGLGAPCERSSVFGDQEPRGRRPLKHARGAALAEEPASGPGAARLPLPAPGSGSWRVGVGAARRSAYSRGNATSFPALRVYRLSMQ